MSQVLYIFRGLPGSGKSTAAAKLAVELGIQHFEADMYFMENGEYKFDPKKIAYVHERCQFETLHELKNGRSVIVSNTFTTVNELLPYITMANDNEADIRIFECIGDYGSIHGVPEATLEKMRLRWNTAEEVYEAFGVNSCKV